MNNFNNLDRKVKTQNKITVTIMNKMNKLFMKIIHNIIQIHLYHLITNKITSTMIIVMKKSWNKKRD